MRMMARIGMVLALVGCGSRAAKHGIHLLWCRARICQAFRQDVLARGDQGQRKRSQVIVCARGFGHVPMLRADWHLNHFAKTVQFSQCMLRFE